MNNSEKRRIKSLRLLPGFGLSLRNKKNRIYLLKKNVFAKSNIIIIAEKKMYFFTVYNCGSGINPLQWVIVFVQAKTCL